MRRVLIFLLFILSIESAFSAEKLPAGELVRKTILKPDTTKVQIRTFDQKKIEAYHKEKEFDYDKKLPSQSNWASQLSDWFWNLINQIFGEVVSGTGTKYIIILILIALITYVVVKGLGFDMMIITGKSKPVEIPYTESLDNIHDIDFNAEIEKAISNSDYRLGIRLSYLYSLKKLNDKKYIDWQAEKTNQVYIAEITDVDKKNQFRELTTLFEYIWYGEFFIDQENFSELKQRFDQFNLKIS